ncbi:hypothetical protein SAMN02745123_01000 [Desulforamulus aeronauticus DSM 10349]|uniref:Uncharacterized protein n=1 Tax=Desulforamulus aeronauticus DSM 10349 TaxID=1121421 RepID=A0A1M6QEB5_9FIRM|nr:hypothetical protein SAMN02745123_01000 [Desulforamulus aeronauticus DSM 10349]
MGNIFVGSLLIIWGLSNVRKWSTEKICRVNSLLRFIYGLIVPLQILLAVYNFKFIYENFYVFGINIIVSILVVMLLVNKKRELLKELNNQED